MLSFMVLTALSASLALSSCLLILAFMPSKFFSIDSTDWEVFSMFASSSWPVLVRALTLYLILLIRVEIDPKVLLKYFDRSPTSSLLKTLSVLVKSPSPSDISLRFSETVMIGFVTLPKTKYTITAVASNDTTASKIENFFMLFTSFMMYSSVEPTITDHVVSEVPMATGTTAISRLVPRVGA